MKTSPTRRHEKTAPRARHMSTWLGFVVGFLALLGLLAGVHSYFEYRQAIKLTEDRLTAQARVIDENLGAQLTTVNLLLSNVIKTMNSAPRLPDAEINNYLNKQDDLIPGIRTVLITDARGRIILSDRKNIIGIDAQGRDFFKSAKAASDRSHLIISPPFQTIFGNYVVNITRAWIGRHGEFLGVVAATLDQEYFTTLIKSVLYAKDNRVYLAHPRGDIIIAMPESPVFTGMNLSQSGSLFKRHVEGRIQTSVGSGPDMLTGDDRLFSFFTIAPPRVPVEQPLVVVVSRNKDEVLAPWRRDVTVQAVLYLLFIGISIVVTKAIARREAERRKAEEAIRRGEEELKALFAILPVGVALIDEKGGLLRLNHALENVLGITEEGWRRGDYQNRRHLRSDGSLMDPEETPAARALKERREVLNVELGVVKEDQTTTWTNMSAAPLPDIGAMIVAVDITERKKAEQERLKSHTLESIGVLAGGIAHDFNNLHTVIMSNIDFVKSSLDPASEAFTRLTHVEEICRMGSNLSRRLLIYATGGEPVKNIASLPTLVAGTIDPVLKGSDIAVRLELPEDLFPIAMDEGQMKQVITNLVMNAKEAMPKGGTLTIRAENLHVASHDALPMREGLYLKLSINDTGIGISSKNLAKIFDPYYSTKDSFHKKGLGLSLAVCYSIVRRHDGLITVESEVGKGTTFHIFLPAGGKA